MIDPVLIQRHYAQLSNEQLIIFAKTEAGTITEAALKVLYAEFVKRELDTTILGNIIEKKSKDKLAAEVPLSHWDYAFNEKKKGVSGTDILKGLLDKRVDRTHASLIVQRLPDIHYENAAFDELISVKCQNSSLGSFFAILFVFGVCAYFMYFGITHKFPLGILFGIGFGFAGFFFIKKFNGEFRGGDYWIELIKTHPENIVWIKPIVTKHTVGFVLTLFKEKQFQLCTKDSLKIVMNCDTDEERRIFFEGVKHLLPHAHIGYSREADAFYYSSPELFIGKLQARGLYTPIDRLNV